MQIRIAHFFVKFVYIVPFLKCICWELIFGPVGRYFIRYCANSPAFVMKCNGLMVCDFESSEQRQTEFQRLIASSLDLLAVHDPVRFARLKRYVKLIVRKRNNSVNYASAYPDIGICMIRDNALGMEKDLPAASLKCSCLLIHEMTHCCIAQKGITHGPLSENRIEDVCLNAELSFAQKTANEALIRWIRQRSTMQHRR